MQSFSDCKLGWSKKPHWTNDYGSFLTTFSTRVNKAAKPEDRCQNVTGWIFRITRILTDYALNLPRQ
jgi:hypothetical protein